MTLKFLSIELFFLTNSSRAAADARWRRRTRHSRIQVRRRGGDSPSWPRLAALPRHQTKSTITTRHYSQDRQGRRREDRINYISEEEAAGHTQRAREGRRAAQRPTAWCVRCTVQWFRRPWWRWTVVVVVGYPPVGLGSPERQNWCALISPARGRWRADGRAEIMPAGRAIESCKTAAAAARASRSVKLIAAVKKKTQVRWRWPPTLGWA
jgi:hypothetical protein